MSGADADRVGRVVRDNTVAFLVGRMAERETLEWALGLDRTRVHEREAVRFVLDDSRARALPTPWSAIWQLVEEMWMHEGPVHPELDVHGTGQRLAAGRRSRVVLDEILDLVRPRLRVESRAGPLERLFPPSPGKPKRVGDLAHLSVTCGPMVDPLMLRLDTVKDAAFLLRLVQGLEAEIDEGLTLMRRLEIPERDPTYLPGRVYPVEGDDEVDPDAWSERGVVSATRLLYEVLQRLVALDPRHADAPLERWRLSPVLIYRRLWAACARDAALATSTDVAEFLAATDQPAFWSLSSAPEIAELRASRFPDLDAKDARVLLARVRRGPPRSCSPSHGPVDQIERYRQRRAAEELGRIHTAGGVLPPPYGAWREAMVAEWPDLAVVGLDVGFPEGIASWTVHHVPDDRFDAMSGAPRLKALDEALVDPESSWSRDPVPSAVEWLRSPGNLTVVIDDLEDPDMRPDDYPAIWGRLSRFSHPAPGTQTEASSRAARNAARLLPIVCELPDKVFAGAVEELCIWLTPWATTLAAEPRFAELWSRLWTRSTTSCVDGPGAAPVGSSPLEPVPGPHAHPAGRLAGMFVDACVVFAHASAPFAVGGGLRAMRDALDAAPEALIEIVRVRLLEGTGLLLGLDEPWFVATWLSTLPDTVSSGPDPWQALSRVRPNRGLIRAIGPRMATQATDGRHAREVQTGLAHHLVTESVNALRRGKPPGVPHRDVGQMLRSVSAEVRAKIAALLPGYLARVPGSAERASSARRAEAFHTSIEPFLREVWPGERSLSTPMVSKAFARLPAAAGDAFAEAAASVRRHLVACPMHTIVEYGFVGDSGEDGLAMIDDASKAGALLDVLDLTVGTDERVVVPYGLSAALARIKDVSPAAGASAPFRRLSALSRSV